MGHGISVICNDCGKKEYLTVGIGFMYPDIFQDTLEEIKQGKHGNEWQSLCNSSEYVAVDAERYFFLCSKCNHWDLGLGMDLYKPNDPDEIRKEKYGDKTVEEWGYMPYWTREQKENKYTLLKKYIHVCPNCNIEMERYDKIPENITELIRCEYCGGKLRRHAFLLSD